MSLGATAEIWRIRSIGEGSLRRTVCPAETPFLFSHISFSVFFILFYFYFLPYFLFLCLCFRGARGLTIYPLCFIPRSQ
jgi:hypothetical protein